MPGTRNRSASGGRGNRRTVNSRPRSRSRTCAAPCAPAPESIIPISESDAILAHLISDAGEENLENEGYIAAKDPEPTEDDMDEMDELDACGMEFVSLIIQDCLDEEDGEARVIYEAPDPPIAECSEAEEEDDDACIHEITTEDCFSSDMAEISSSASSQPMDEVDTDHEKVKKLLLDSLDQGTLEAAICESMQPKNQLQETQALVKSVLISSLQDNSLEEALKLVNQEEPSPHEKAKTLLLDALEDGSLEAIISETMQKEDQVKDQSIQAKTRDLLCGALEDGSLESTIKEVMPTEEVEQKQKLEPEEEKQDLPRPAFRPENAFFFEMMCNLLDCSIDGTGRAMFPEPEEEVELDFYKLSLPSDELALPSAASLAPCTRRPFARRLVPTGPSAPVPAEPFPMDCLPPLEQQTSSIFSDPGRLPEATPSNFDQLLCRPAGHVTQGVVWFTPCRSGQHLPKEEVLPCPELLPEKDKLGQHEAAKRIQKAFREHAALVSHARYFGELKKMQELAAQLSAPAAPLAPIAPAEPKSLTPTAPVAPKSPRRMRRPQPSVADTKLSTKPEMVSIVPEAPSLATPKSAPTRKRRPVAPPANLPTFRMDSDTEVAPTKEAKEGLAKEFMALDAELYNLDGPARPVTPKTALKSPRSLNIKPVSALMLDLADDSKDMRQARSDASTRQKERMESVYSIAATSLLSTAAPSTPSKRSLSLGSKQGLQGGKVLPALTPRHSQALVESGNRMANQALTPRGRYF